MEERGRLQNIQIGKLRQERLSDLPQVTQGVNNCFQVVKPDSLLGVTSLFPRCSACPLLQGGSKTRGHSVSHPKAF